MLKVGGPKLTERHRARRFSSRLDVRIKSATSRIASKSLLTLFHLVSSSLHGRKDLDRADDADNVSRCQQLMLDFRKENYVKAWKDDVLQLYNVMW